jgi:hypothetical protein
MGILRIVEKLQLASASCQVLNRFTVSIQQKTAENDSLCWELFLAGRSRHRFGQQAVNR